MSSISISIPTLVIGSTELRDAVFRCMFHPEKRYEGRAWRERYILRPTLLPPKLEDTSGNSQGEPSQQVKGETSPHKHWPLGP